MHETSPREGLPAGIVLAVSIAIVIGTALAAAQTLENASDLASQAERLNHGLSDLTRAVGAAGQISALDHHALKVSVFDQQTQVLGHVERAFSKLERVEAIGRSLGHEYDICPLHALLERYRSAAVEAAARPPGGLAPGIEGLVAADDAAARAAVTGLRRSVASRIEQQQAKTRSELRYFGVLWLCVAVWSWVSVASARTARSARRRAASGRG